MFSKDLLKPGDVLLYRSKGLFGWLIAFKTWHKISHCESYIGDKWSVASRDGEGVNCYSLRESELQVVLRIKPEYSYSLYDALAWFKTVKGQKYDWKGLLVFTLAVKQGSKDRMFCSEFLARFLRAGGVDPFNGVDADTIAPFQFEVSPVFDVIWRAE